MTKLYGFAVSNYYNMAKFALLEKGAKFEEVAAMPSQESDYKAKSPMGKVPCLETDKGFMSETNVILEYIEASMGGTALLPSDAFAAAKVREVMKVVELYIELPARRHYGELFFGGPRNQAAFDEAKPVMENGVAALEGAVLVQALPVRQFQPGRHHGRAYLHLRAAGGAGHLRLGPGRRRAGTRRRPGGDQRARRRRQGDGRSAGRPEGLPGTGQGLSQTVGANSFAH